MNLPRATVLALCLAAPAMGWAASADGPATKPVAPVVDAGTYLSLEDLQKYFDQKLYEFVAQQAGKIQLNKKVLEKYDIPELLGLRAEALLQSGRFRKGAIDAFGEAARAAAKDERKAAVFEATATLIERTPTGKYTPKTVNGKPAPTGAAAPAPMLVTDLDKRSAIIKALYEDELATIDGTVKTALAAKTLPPIATAATSVATLRYLEIAATGSDTKTAATRQGLAQHAADLMGLAVEKSQTLVTQIDRNANTLVAFYETVPNAAGGATQELRHRKQGLTRNDVATLNGIVREADQIPPAAKEFADRLKVDAKIFEKVSPAAAKVGQQAKLVLTADYSTVYGGTLVQPRR